MKDTEEITNSADVIDSRDVIARIEYLEGERAAITDELDELRDDEVTNHVSEIAELETRLEAWDGSEEGNELKALQSLAEEASGYAADWNHGEALIRDSYFEEYARDLADDCGMIPKDNAWPLCHIDWEAAAEALKADYMSVDFDGVDYWIRA
jgi:hypothetical protein